LHSLHKFGPIQGCCSTSPLARLTAMILQLCSSPKQFR